MFVDICQIFIKIFIVIYEVRHEKHLKLERKHLGYFALLLECPYHGQL